jgi:hypothetical protein
MRGPSPGVYERLGPSPDVYERLDRKLVCMRPPSPDVYEQSLYLEVLEVLEGVE